MANRFVDPSDRMGIKDSEVRLTAQGAIHITSLTPPPYPAAAPEVPNFTHSAIPTNWAGRYPSAAFGN